MPRARIQHVVYRYGCMYLKASFHRWYQYLRLQRKLASLQKLQWTKLGCCMYLKLPCMHICTERNCRITELHADGTDLILRDRSNPPGDSQSASAGNSASFISEAKHGSVMHPDKDIMCACSLTACILSLS